MVGLKPIIIILSLPKLIILCTQVTAEKDHFFIFDLIVSLAII